MNRAYIRHLNEFIDAVFDRNYAHYNRSDRELAAAADLNVNTVIRIASKQTRLPRHLTIWKLATAVGMTLSQSPAIRLAEGTSTKKAKRRKTG